MLRAGRTTGVFQFESPLATDMLRSMRCDRFDDLVASNALMRPGPLDAGMHRVYQRRKRGEEPVTLRAARARADSRADVRRHHLPGTGDAHRAGAGGHLARRSRRAAQSGRQEGRGAHSRGARQVRREVGRARLRPHGSSRSWRGRSRRSAATASTSRTPSRIRSSRITRRGSRRTIRPSSWRRCCRRRSATRTASSSSSTRRASSASRCSPPDVNESGYKFTVIGDKRIRFGLGAIRNVGRSAIDSILAARAEKTVHVVLRFLRARRSAAVQQARVRSADRVRRARQRSAGTARSTGRCSTARSQEASLKQQEAAVGPVLAARRRRRTDVARGTPRVPAEHRAAERVGAADEGEGDPRLLHLRASARAVPRWSASCSPRTPCLELGKWTDQPVALGVVVTAVKRQISKRSGAEFARLTVEDFSGSSEVLVFPEAWTMLADRVKTDVLCY